MTLIFADFNPHSSLRRCEKREIDLTQRREVAKLENGGQAFGSILG
jgi:hypothetical protein